MAELLGVVFTLVVLVFVFLPILSFLRLAGISRDIEELRARVAQLEKVRQVPEVPQVRHEAHPAAATAPEASVRDAAAMPEPVVTSKPPVTPQAAVTPMAAAAPVETVAPAPDDLEERIGGRGLLYAGVLVLLLGISFFLKYAFDNAWVNETARVVLGAISGTALVVGGMRFARAGLPVFGQALAGGGFAVLYLVAYAALNFYGLIDRGTAFVVMIAITLAAATVAHREQSQALAFLAVGGGFLTPALVGGDESAQLVLFSYVAVLVIGTMLLSFAHQWLALNVLSYIGTFLTVVAWAGRFYTSDQWLRTFLFLTLFCVAFLIILRETRRSAAASAPGVRGLISTAPLFYHLAAVIITAAHPPAIHIYLIAITAVGLWLTAEPHRPVLRLAVLLGAFVPMFGTLTLPAGPAWLVPNVVVITTVALLHIMGIVDRIVRQDARASAVDLLTLHLAGLGLFALLYEVLQPALPDLRGALAVLIALGAGGLWRLLRERDETAALHAAALAFTLIAIGIGVQFDGATVIIGWAAEAAGLVWLGGRARHLAFQFGGLALWVLAAMRLFDSFGATPAAFTALANARTFATFFVVAAGYVIVGRLGAVQTPESPRLRVAVHVIASAVTLRWITAEIQSFWDVRANLPQAFLYEQMLLSLAWGLYGAALIVVGMMRKYPPLRYIGIFVIGATSLKVFFYDLWELGGIYRVVGFISFGVLLVLVSYLYQSRQRVSRPPAA